MQTTGGDQVVCRGVRGAITVESNIAEEILEATDLLLRALRAANGVEPDDIASAIFTTTTDLDATFPAIAARNLGWGDVPLLCTHEMAVPGALQCVVRVLLNVNTSQGPRGIRHVYLRGAAVLRPDWAVSDEELTRWVGNAVPALPA